MRVIQLFTLIALLGLAACGTSSGDGDSQATSISIKGSDTVLPLSTAHAEEFMKVHPESAITIVGGGSGTGITALMDGSTDICMSSRELKIEEKLKFAEKGIDYREVILGSDALSVIVHPSNKISQLTSEQLEGIFTGAITNWKEVGGDDMKIIAYSRESSSGTYEFFKDHVMDKKNYASSVLNMPATGAIVQSISQTLGAIGYIGLAYMTGSIKALSVSYDQGTTFVEPSLENALDKTYPISRPLYYFYDVKNEAKVKPFIDFCLSQQGQEIVSKTGYIPTSSAVDSN